MALKNKFVLSNRSELRLEGVHVDLVKVVNRAIELTPIDFVVLEGLRDLERQKVLKANGASKTLNSRHLTGHAVDLGAWLDGKVDWSWPLYYKIASAMKKAANELKVPIIWGGDWSGNFRDGPHFELNKRIYP